MGHQTIVLAGALISCMFVGYYLHISSRGSTVQQYGGPKSLVPRTAHHRPADTGNTNKLSTADSRRTGCIDYNDTDIFHGKEQVDKLVMNEFFRGMQNGFFLEMGAWDGIQKSTTLVFERHFHWKGILIESNPVSYEKVLVNRPSNTDNIYAAICPKGKNVLIGGKENRAKTHFTEESRESIPCVPMDELLRERKIEHIHFFSLDVEGVELDVLKTINFDQVVIDVFMIEMHERRTPDEHRLVREFLETKGYNEFVCIHKNYGCKQGKNGNTFYVRVGFTSPC